MPTPACAAKIALSTEVQSRNRSGCEGPAGLAWISRAGRGDAFDSNVSLGKGRIYKLTTGTANRRAALEFNRSHLIAKLTGRASSAPVVPPQQTHFEMD